ncbi:MAG TPA: hypothetical protein DD381_01080 [Lentisphaeria bacterium]|nr:MAG: hypothetical protein A2X47_05900 [Lentisphaerae bacterium GWF2_38_69]HBM14936.1 hypothetical protein [Lentisphaeria bacterium]
MTMTGKIGCLFVYSIIMIIIGMGLYKYRTEVIEYLSEKYHELAVKVQDKVDETKTQVIEEAK